MPFGDGSVNVVVDPNRAGNNAIHLYLFDEAGRVSDQDFDELTVELSLPSADIGPIERVPFVAGPGHYQVDGSDLSIPGDWTIEVIGRVDRFDQVTAERHRPREPVTPPGRNPMSRTTRAATAGLLGLGRHAAHRRPGRRPRQHRRAEVPAGGFTDGDPHRPPRVRGVADHELAIEIPEAILGVTPRSSPGWDVEVDGAARRAGRGRATASRSPSATPSSPTPPSPATSWPTASALGS